ncbi:hypothetical protein EsH8_II_000021 [Colletotrichum jinshuiense]
MIPTSARIMISTYQSVNSTAPRIQLASIPQLAEAISREDDWTGTKDAAARRRAQTRLNTRAYHHLITLLQFNAIRALAINRTLISGILTTPLDCDEEITHVIPYPTNPEKLPSSLLPTTLQQTVPHGDWIDLFPCAEGRDRLIQAAGTFDEDELWADCIGGLYEGFPDDEIKRRGIIAWSPPWDIVGWEISEGFLEKWGCRDSALNLILEDLIYNVTRGANTLDDLVPRLVSQNRKCRRCRPNEWV